MSQKTFYITTPIYYTSGKLHIGNAYTTTVCDTIARYKKAKGYAVFFLTGTDEHGEKVQQKAAEAGKSPKQYVDDLVVGIKDLWSKLDIDYDHFVRTTDDYHEHAVQDIFSKFLQQGDIYKGEYEGWYCTQCEAYWTESQLLEGNLCPDCGRPVHKAKEESYFFNMKKYTDKLNKYYEDHPDFIEPVSRKNEIVNNFIKPGLGDLSVSRTTFDWGVKVKEDPSHVVYVWLDALFNYVTALGYGSSDPSNFNKFWHNDENHEVLHVVGKEIIRFHMIYWPIFLMALDLELPTKLFAHGWIVMKEGKMSKSKGNVIYPDTIINRYGVDALRYYLDTCIPFGQDGLFTPELFVDNFNNDLVNNYGNLLSRSISMVIKYFGGKVPVYQGAITPFDDDLEQALKKQKQQYEAKMDAYQIDEGFKAVFDLLSKANKYIDDTKPWELAKDASKQKELASVMTHLILVLQAGTVMLKPMLVNTYSKVIKQLGIDNVDYDSILDLTSVDNLNVSKGDNIFPRLDAKSEVEYLAQALKG